MQTKLPNGMTPLGSYESIRNLVARCEKRGWVKRTRDFNHQEIKAVKDKLRGRLLE